MNAHLIENQPINLTFSTTPANSHGRIRTVAMSDLPPGVRFAIADLSVDLDSLQIFKQFTAPPAEGSRGVRNQGRCELKRFVLNREVSWFLKVSAQILLNYMEIHTPYSYLNNMDVTTIIKIYIPSRASSPIC